MTRTDELVLAALSGQYVGSGGWARVDCPFCLVKTGKDGKRKLNVKVDRGFYQCMKCGTRGFISEDSRDYVPPAPAPKEPDPDEEKPYLGPPEGYLPLWEDPAYSSLAAEDARAFLLGRGVPEDVWQRARIGVCLQGRYANRVILPIIDAAGEWQGWSGRVWVKKAELKYIYPSGMNRAEVMFNEAALYVDTDEPLIVGEGIFDALPYWPDGTAVMGKPSHAQRAKLAKVKRPIAVALDGDAWEEGQMLALALQMEGARAGCLRFAPKTNPDEYPTAVVRDAARACIGHFEPIRVY